MSEKKYLDITDYQSWTEGLYLIDAGCGMGKSSFIFNTLYPYAHENGKSMLVFSNRLALKKQQEIQGAGTDIRFMTYQRLEFDDYMNGLIITTYIDNLMNVVRTFDYIVLDEAHYLFQDASFNRNTQTILNMVEELRATKKIIMLSATPELLRIHFAQKIEKEYKAEPDYSYIKNVYFYNKKETVNKIIDDVPADEKILMFGDNKQRLQELQRKYENSAYLSSDNKVYSSVFDEITKQEQFSCRILFTTKVLDNGVNLKDKGIKHIIIEMADMVEFIQCLGRKRVQDENDTVTLYFLNNVGRIKRRYKKLQDDMKIANDYFDLREHIDIDEFKQKYLKDELPNFFDNRSELIYPTYFKAKNDYEFYQLIVNGKTSFIKVVSERLGQRVKKYEDVARGYEVASYLSKNIGRKYFKQDREELVRIFDIRHRRKLQKSLGMLNQFLQDNQLGYEIEKKCEYVGKRRIYWEIIECRK